ncbi:MAG: tyrosine-protein phosphatase [Prevotellaceae bacterium]|jgi:protein tyrosine/serine phosphatase|nr:tyrosine-protein phosphatase [Prevotellaceae bacterium]
MKRFIVLFIFLALRSATLAAQPAVKIDGCGLNNLYEIDSGVYRSEQPDEQQFRLLERYGIKEVLNLRYWHSDEKIARNSGLKLHRVRMMAHHINDYDVVRALRIIRNRQHPILIHCHHGSDRTGLVAAMYRLVFQKRSKKTVIEEMTDPRFGFHGIYANIVKYIENADAERIRILVENTYLWGEF